MKPSYRFYFKAIKATTLKEIFQYSFVKNSSFSIVGHAKRVQAFKPVILTWSTSEKVHQSGTNLPQLPLQSVQLCIQCKYLVNASLGFAIAIAVVIRR